ncbi:MAG: class I SAM-dependent methyltransferase [Planctomycetaceae bacterium]|nr:class I SAM-dependent methyltransferase [Planctomycetaceae bacterium]
MVSLESRSPLILHEELESFLYPTRVSESDQLTLRSNPLDELDCVNHYCFGGLRNMNRNFLVLSINDHSPGDETLFLAVQLRGTESTIVHFDWSPLAAELLKARAARLGLADQIIWVAGDLQNIHHLFTDGSSDDLDEDQVRPLGHGQFDYVRCCGALDRVRNFEATFDAMLKFLKPNGALGMSCLGYYGREPYRQFQTIAAALGSDNPGLQEEVDRLKELFVFLPQRNWTRLAYDNLLPEIRSMKDDAFAAHFVRRDIHSWTVPKIYELLRRHNLDLANFSRKTRMYYQPWFAQKNPELFRLVKLLPLEDTQAISEIVWNTIEEHCFWATREKSARVDPNDWGNVLFFNPIPQNQKKWRERFLATGGDAVPQLTVTLTPDEKYTIDLPWNPQIRRMIELIDGQRTFKEILMTIREEMETPLGMEEILQSCGSFLAAAEFEDVILMRHRNAPVLPFTASTFK